MTDTELAIMTYSVIKDMRIAGISESDCDDLKAKTDNGLLVEFVKRIIASADLKAFGSLAKYIGYYDSTLTDYDCELISQAIIGALMGIKIDHAD